MAVQLVLRRPAPTPAAQLRVVWQGHREGDRAQATWTDSTGATHGWPGTAGVRWIQRDGLRQGEEWKVNLPGVPADVDRIILQLTTTLARTVGIAVRPLTGSPDDALQHPGAELAAGEPKELLMLTRSGTGWLVTAVNSAIIDGAADLVEYSSSRAPRRSPENEDLGPQVQIPPRLEQAVDAARAGGNIRRRSAVGAVVDLSASMRPWIVSGQLADVLTAVQAVAGASNRPSVTTRFLPADREVDLALATEPTQVLGTQLAASGLRTGNRSALLGTVGAAVRRGGLQVLVTDDASVAAAGPAVTVLLGPADGGFTAAGPRPKIVMVPPGPVDVRRLARELADATAGG